MAVIQTNLSSLVAQRNKLRSESALNTAIQRLSSGLRINSAKDDAAGQAIANRFTSNIKGLDQAIRNTNDGISLSQTAQGALNEINSRLQRVRELSVQGLSGIYEGDTSDHIQAEINLNLKEIDRLNNWASFNGVQLLDGTAGTISLQVGAHDKDKLPVDLGVPGFGVQELGLLDFNIQGDPNSITPVSFMTGTATRIDLDDAAHTAVTYVPPDNNPNLVKPSRASSRDVIQIDGPGGRLMEVSINASHDTDTRQNNVRLGVISAVRSTTVQESISNWVYLDDSGNTLPLSQPTVVQSGGRYWIQHRHNGENHYYEVELTIHGDQHRITAQAKSNTRVSQADMPGGISQPLRYAPAVSKATAQYSLTLDGNDELANPNLVLAHLGGFYYVEEHLGGGQYAYYQADVTITTGGAQSSIVVNATRAQAISVSDEPYVTGTSTVHLKPANNNVRVNYIDLAGRTHTNVMKADENSDYMFHVNDNAGGDDASKTAKVVRNQDGRYMLQTFNGMGEVVLYYPLYYQNSDGSYVNSFSISTNVENNLTTLTLREADIAQRLRTPPDPLAALDRAIARVDAKRSELGALDNRLQAIINANTQTQINMSAARSRIEDADYAREVANMTRAQILKRASASVLAQANQVPQAVLTLLGRF